MTSREPSAAPSSGGDTVDEQIDEARLAPHEVDHEDTASDAPQPAEQSAPVKSSKKGKGAGAKKPRPKKGTHVWVMEGVPDGTEDESPGPLPSASKNRKLASPDVESKTHGPAVGTRRQANGTVGSVYSGSKIRHIKKPDGTPLWRKEIQYEFLRLVIQDETRCFTRVSDGQKGMTFADIYIDCMSRSSKTSKILKDRLHIDRPAAENMAMICLLVNVGRMNTTLNFFPEMRAQLRTYHSIPSLQAYKTQQDYKSLQDAPRLKSILKGASEDTDEPRSLQKLRATSVPRTNPVNLIFVLSHFAHDIAPLHFTDKVDFFDLAIRSTISSRSRARAFLWLMWWYLESQFDAESSLNNPFGAGEYKERQDAADSDEIPQLVPKLEYITEEEGDAENLDPEEERQFAERKTKERKRIMSEVLHEEAPTPAGSGKEPTHKGIKRLKKSARDFGDEDSDADSFRASPGAPGRSPAPADNPSNIVSGTAQAESVEDDWDPADANPGRGKLRRARGKGTPTRGKTRPSDVGPSARGGVKSRLGISDRETPDTNRGTPQPLPSGISGHPVLSQLHSHRSRQDMELLSAAAGSTPSLVPIKSRARTGYQRELEEHKQRRIEWLLRKKRRETLKDARAKRSSDRWLFTVACRIGDLDALYDSEEDELIPNFINGTTGAEASLGVSVGLGGILGRKMREEPHATRSRSGDNTGDDAAGEGGDAEIPAVTTKISTKPDPDSSAPIALDDNEDAPNNDEVVNKNHNDGNEMNGKQNADEDGVVDDDDYGEEAESWLKVLKRTKRRLETWSGEKDEKLFHSRQEQRKQRQNQQQERQAERERDRERDRDRGQELEREKEKERASSRDPESGLRQEPERERTGGVGSASTAKRGTTAPKNATTVRGKKDGRNGRKASKQAKKPSSSVFSPSTAAVMAAAAANTPTTRRRNLQDEITQELLAERSENEDDEVDGGGEDDGVDGDDDDMAEDDEDADGDVTMADEFGGRRLKIRRGRGDDSDVEMD